MRVHHLDCGTMCPLSARLVNGTGGWLAPGQLVCHCLLVESEDGLVLVDTGIGLAACGDAAHHLGRGFMRMARPRLDPEQSAARRILRLGFSTDDVRHIVATHLDLDHTGGLCDFPNAKVHVYAREHRAALDPPTFLERRRYRAEHWAHGPRWELHEVAGERWRGFDAVRAIEGVGPEVLLVPLVGHSRGHCGVAVQAGAGWLLHCGDAYFYRGEMDPDSPSCTPALRAMQTIVEVDRQARHSNQARLRALAREARGELRLFCAHDAVELASCQTRAPAPGDLSSITP